MLYSGTIISLIATILLGGSIAPYDTASIQEIPTVIIEQEKKIPIADPVEVPSQPTQNNPLVGYDDRKSWWFSRNNTHTPPSAQHDIAIGKYDAYYLGDTQSKTIYLTFDEGYENGYTEQILDVLKENDVQAAFFVTKSYIRDNPELIKRMAAEGHIVGNHSVTHPDMTKLTSEQMAAEINDCAAYFKEVTGKEMPRFFRPPEGVYSIHSLDRFHPFDYPN